MEFRENTVIRIFKFDRAPASLRSVFAKPYGLTWIAVVPEADRETWDAFGIPLRATYWDAGDRCWILAWVKGRSVARELQTEDLFAGA